MSTYLAKKGEIKKEHYVVDADGKVLGRLATRVATVLMGKHKVTYTSNVDVGDFVTVLNAEKVRVTGKKRSEKIYRRYSGYPSGLKEESFERLQGRRPKLIIETAVRRMLPKSRLGVRMFKKMKVYTGSEKPGIAKNAKQITV